MRDVVEHVSKPARCEKSLDFATDICVTLELNRFLLLDVGVRATPVAAAGEFC
jgi:hypothetical protein